MKVRDLYETPMLIGDHEFDPIIDGFDLTDNDENQKAYDKISKSKKSHQIEKHNDSQYLYHFGDKVVLLNTVLRTVDYYVKIETGKFKITGKYVAQVEVWRSNDRPVYGVVEKVFFDHILKSHDTVLSDSLQTNDGKRLWTNLVSYAFDRGKFVYVVDLNNGVLKQVNDVNDYSRSVQDFYSDQKSSMKIRIMISNRETVI